MKNNQTASAKKTASGAAAYLVKLPAPKTRSQKNKTDRQLKMSQKSIKKPSAKSTRAKKTLDVKRAKGSR
jgi:hypothetical protein